ncbi:hypothetical protein B0H14DRAFT_1379582, partial [Mycena olivaceomarginata]
EGRPGRKRKRETKLAETRYCEEAEQEAPGIGVEPDKTICVDGKTLERAGVIHAAHCWHQQGTKKGDIIGPSRDMNAGGLKAAANVHYFKATEEVALFIGEFFKVLFPEEYERYKEDFERGVWLTEDPGPILGRALIYKLQVYVHQDGLDRGPTASFPCGFFDEGAMTFTDIDAVYRYGTGDICFSMSAILYHGVQPWAPTPVPDHRAINHITPGRVSTVFFCPSKTAETLADKPPHWNRDRAGGLLPPPFCLSI